MKVLFNIIKCGFKLFHKKPKIYGIDNFEDDAPAIFLCNHENIYGPVITTTRFPIDAKTWANSMMTEKAACRKYIAKEFFQGDLGLNKHISKLLGNVFGGLVSWALRSANPIISYWDIKRVNISLRNGLDVIKNGENQLMFAKSCDACDKDFEFMQGYLLLCKLAIRTLKISPKVYPVSINSKEKFIAIGKPTMLNKNSEWKIEKYEMNKYLVEMVKLGYNDPKAMTEFAGEFEKGSCSRDHRSI